MKAAGEKGGRTVAVDLPAAEKSGNGDGEGNPCLVDNGGADNQEGGGNVHAGHVLRCQWAGGLSGMSRHYGVLC